VRPTLYVGGTFDLPHAGHVRLFQRVSQLGVVVVSLNTDAFTGRYKRVPILNLEERRQVISAIRWVDSVIVNEGDEDSRPAILKSRANYVVHSDDWKPDSLLPQMGLTWEWLHENGIGLVYVPHTDGISTSEIIERCRQPHAVL